MRKEKIVCCVAVALLLMVVWIARVATPQYNFFEKDNYRIVKNGVGKYWVEEQFAPDPLGWSCSQPCIEFNTNQDADNYLQEIIKRRTHVVVKELTVKR
uniref:Uncharacterized protein n=1 Tax=viral metagenome TaxID=1070528 RepID=A0A6M3XVZ8_9ZZZZ